MSEETDLSQKKVFIISDGIGQSAINVIKASLIQFDVSTSMMRVFSRMDNIGRIKVILDQAKEANAFVAFTIVKHEVRDQVRDICREMGLMYHDILGPPIDKLSKYLGLVPKESAKPAQAGRR